jgi:hypothetical protein
MDRISGIESDDEFVLKVENMILGKLFADSEQQTLQTSYEELQRSLTEVEKYPIFQTALNNLIISGLISRIGNDDYRITDNGIGEYQTRTQR